MKSGQAHNGSFIHRWLSRTSNSSADNASSNVSNLESNFEDTFSQPPLTDSSSTTDSTSTILTPKTSYALSPTPSKFSSRFAVAKTPRTPPTKYAALPSSSTTSARKVAVSFSGDVRQSSALVVAPPCLKLHRLLNYDPVRRALIFDISCPPSSILQCPSPSSQSAMVLWRQPKTAPPLTSAKPISEYDLTQYATTPPVNRMKIVANRMPWTINVHGRTTLTNGSRSFVRVVDVFDAVYNSLRTGVTNDEWNRAQKSFREQVKKAYLRRCRASRPFTITGYEEKQGVRRIDYLHDATMFLGLAIKPLDEGGGRQSNIESGEDSTWVMMLGPRPC